MILIIIRFSVPLVPFGRMTKVHGEVEVSLKFNRAPTDNTVASALVDAEAKLDAEIESGNSFSRLLNIILHGGFSVCRTNWRFRSSTFARRKSAKRTGCWSSASKKTHRPQRESFDRCVDELNSEFNEWLGRITGGGPSSDPLVVVEIEGCKAQKTSYKSKELNPVWKETLTFKGVTEPHLTLKITVEDYETLKNQFLGRVMVPLSSLYDKRGAWISLSMKVLAIIAE